MAATCFPVQPAAPARGSRPVRLDCPAAPALSVSVRTYLSGDGARLCRPDSCAPLKTGSAAAPAQRLSSTVTAARLHTPASHAHWATESLPPPNPSRPAIVGPQPAASQSRAEPPRKTSADVIPLLANGRPRRAGYGQSQRCLQDNGFNAVQWEQQVRVYCGRSGAVEAAGAVRRLQPIRPAQVTMGWASSTAAPLPPARPATDTD